MAWYSKILTNTTSQFSNLQSRLLANENDGDTEDDTHVCRVLRAYYTEQGRPFPPWLPPDPKAPPPPAPVSAQQSQVGSRYGGLAHQQNPSGSLSSLWDSNPTPSHQQQQQQRLQGSQSLRQPRVAAAPASRPPAGGGGMYARESATATAPPTNPSTGASAQDRLKQRLWGGGSRTTSPGSGSQGPFQPPGSGSGGYGAGSPAMSGGGGTAGDRPYVGPNAPWSAGGRGGGLPSGPKMR